MVPFINAQPESAEARFNNAFKSCRILIELCIGRLKNVFRCLHKHRVLHYSPLTASNIIYACATLHNIRLSMPNDEGTNQDENDIEGQFTTEGDLDTSTSVTNTNNSAMQRRAQQIRQDLVTRLISSIT